MNVHQKPDKTAEKAKKQRQPPQVQEHQPGVESKMRPRPEFMPKYPGCGKLKDKVAADTGKKLLCPMPGLVKAIAVAEGQEVKAGETLAVVEAMKMENVLRAERDGTVKKLHAKPGDSLAVDAVILEFA